MERVIPLETPVKPLSKNRTLDGFGDALGETPTPTIKIGADKEIERNLLVLVFLLEMMTPWTSR